MSRADQVRAALQRAIDAHGSDNAFTSRWLHDAEGCPATPAQINRVGRAWPRWDLRDGVEATYAGGVWTVGSTCTSAT